ncbi:hypothetical protein E4U25_003911 [Claviceps purpurea]|nr:hypothetical protein E4U25_003911 [Claviceps purpurea]
MDILNIGDKWETPGANHVHRGPTAHMHADRRLTSLAIGGMLSLTFVPRRTNTYHKFAVRTYILGF